MSDLFTPGEHRAGELMSDRALVAAMIKVEWAWHAVLADAGVAPPIALGDVDLSDSDIADLTVASEAGGNPVIPLVELLRERTGASWLHRGLTSQDVMDTALMLLLRQVLDAVIGELVEQVGILRRLAEKHAETLCVGRTLTQHAVPTTFGLIASRWLDGLLDVLVELDARRRELRVQVGGAAGTLAAVELLAPGRSLDLVSGLAGRLDLEPAGPWHVSRRLVTAVADALAASVDAWSLIANDVLVRCRPEIAELGEDAAEGRGGSSTMPHKQNPVLSVLIRRSALNAPFLAAALHAAASAEVDQRSDGGWHAEWAPLRTLSRLTALTARQATELLAHLRVDERTMATTAGAAADALMAESRSLAHFADATAPTAPADYLGAHRRLITATLDRAGLVLEGVSR